MTEIPTIVTIEARTGNQVPGSSGRALPHLLVEIRNDLLDRPDLTWLALADNS